MFTRRAGAYGATRLVMLEAVREYAAERLAERPDAAEAEERHGRHYLELAEAAHPGLMGPDQVAWTRRIDAEAANVLRALERARDTGDAALVLRVMTALDEWWFARGLWSEGRAWFRWGLDHSDESVPPEIRAAAWQCLGYLLWPENEPDRVLEAADRSWELASTAGDVTSMAWSVILRAHALAVKPDGPAAVAAAEEAVRLARDVDDQALGVAYEALAISTRDRDERRRTARLAAEHLERAGDLRALGRMCEELSYAALVDGQVHEAAELIERAMVLREQLDDPAELVWTLVTGGLVALERGDDAAAQRHLVDALDQYLSRGIRAMLPEALLALAALAARAGDPVRAGRLVGAAHAAGTFDELDRRLEATAREAAGAPPGEWERAVGAGQALSWDEGIELALEPAESRCQRIAGALKARAGRVRGVPNPPIWRTACPAPPPIAAVLAMLLFLAPAASARPADAATRPTRPPRSRPSRRSCPSGSPTTRSRRRTTIKNALAQEQSYSTKGNPEVGGLVLEQESTSGSGNQGVAQPAVNAAPPANDDNARG